MASIDKITKAPIKAVKSILNLGNQNTPNINLSNIKPYKPINVQDDVKRLAEIEFLKDNNVSQSTLDNPFFGYQYKERVKGYEDDISNAYMSPPEPSLTKTQMEDLAGEEQVDQIKILKIYHLSQRLPIKQEVFTEKIQIIFY